MSQIDLARTLGLAQATVSKAESGHDFRVSTLIQMARALDVELLLVPRNLVPAIAVILGDTGRDRISDESDELYSEDLDPPHPSNVSRVVQGSFARSTPVIRNRDLRDLADRRRDAATHTGDARRSQRDVRDDHDQQHQQDDEL